MKKLDEIAGGSIVTASCFVAARHDPAVGVADTINLLLANLTVRSSFRNSAPDFKGTEGVVCRALGLNLGRPCFDQVFYECCDGSPLLWRAMLKAFVFGAV
jgi:hypothetical protein